MDLSLRILNILLTESPFPAGTTPHVFCDVDGVLANFYAGLEVHFGVDKKSVNDFLLNRDGWELIANEEPHLFAKLPLLPDAKGLISGLTRLRDNGKIRLSILTAIPDEWYRDATMRKRSTQDKVTWITRHFQKINAKDVLVVRRRDKQEYVSDELTAGNPAPVLIDDFSKNIREWEHAGGLGIPHTSGSTSLLALHTYLE